MMTQKLRMAIVLSSVGLASFVAVSDGAHAAEEKSGGADASLSASGGIVEPGAPTAVFRNPAGLVGLPTFGVTLQGGASDSFNYPFFRGGLVGGGKDFKLAGGLTQTTTNPTSTSLFYGLGIAAGSGFSIGLSGSTGLSRGGGTMINAGTIFSGSLPVKLGATIMGINNGINEWGLGVSGKLGPVDLILDGAYNSGTESVGLKPGLKVGNESAALTLSYGFADAASTIQLYDEFTAGASFKLGPSTIQLYYNDFARFYLAATIAI